MILVTSAAGKSGKAVIRSLSIKNEEIRALVHRKEYEGAVKEAGVMEIAVGDMMDMDFMNEASKGVKAIYHIGPSASPNMVCKRGSDRFRAGPEAANMAAAEALRQYE